MFSWSDSQIIALKVTVTGEGLYKTPAHNSQAPWGADACWWSLAEGYIN